MAEIKPQLQRLTNQVLLGKLVSVHKGLKSNTQSFLRDFSISAESCYLLLFLSKQPLAMAAYNDISNMGFDTEALAKGMKQLINTGYLKRVTDKETGGKFLKLNERGIKSAEQLKGFEELINASFSRLNNFEKHQLLNLLSKVQNPVVFNLA